MSLDQFDPGHLGGVANTLAETNDPRVPARSFGESWTQDVEQLLNDLPIVQARRGHPAMVLAVGLSDR